MTNADVARLINSDEIQSVVTPAKTSPKFYGKKLNALKNKKAMFKLKRASTAGTKENESAKKRKAASGEAAKKHHKLPR